jgi:hypothetical protein
MLALVAPAAEGEARLRLEEVLGTRADDGFARATALLETPHPAVGLASGLWARRELLTTAYDRFASSLPDVVAHGGVPSQLELDEWARRHSLGLIEQFPLPIEEDTAIVLADALAIRVQWDEPFEVAEAQGLLWGEWERRVAGVLRAPQSHDMFIADTDAAGDVAVHAARSATGLTVVSVIAGPAVPPSSVNRAAHDVAELMVSGSQRCATPVAVRAAAPTRSFVVDPGGTGGGSRSHRAVLGSAFGVGGGEPRRPR